jgi:archaellum component FlaC
MATKYPFKIQPVFGLSLLVCGLTFTSCGSKPAALKSQPPAHGELDGLNGAAFSTTNKRLEKSSGTALISPAVIESRAAADVTSKPTASSPESAAKSIVQTLPQLIKTADLSLKVKSIEPALAEVRNLVKQTKGDIYNFEDQKPNDAESHHQVSMEIKVPQTQLDDVLAKFGKLGTITNQKVKAEDVTTQLVDIDARLKNLRQEETMISKIMERAGSVKDVLGVSKELSRVRSEIESIDATQKSLRGRVAYSTINLQLEESVATIKDSGNPIGVRVGETWNSSTHMVGETATNLVLLLIGLVPFIPLFALGGGAFYLYHRVKPKVQPEPRPILDPSLEPIEPS